MVKITLEQICEELGRAIPPPETEDFIKVQSDSVAYALAILMIKHSIWLKGFIGGLLLAQRIYDSDKISQLERMATKDADTQEKL